MDEATAEKVCGRLSQLGCHSVHIGGGEPFLNVDGLIVLIKTIYTSGLSLDYIETNAAWITDDDHRNKRILSDVVNAGGDCIMVSADPFHIEFIPFWKPDKLIQLLRETGTQHFIWQERYLPMLRKLDPKKTYKSDELKMALGYDAAFECTREYGMRFNGRALNLQRKYSEKKPIEKLLETCPEVYNTNHFHADYLGRYVPPGCTGIGIGLDDLGKSPDPEKYPVISRLFDGGVRNLFEYALDLGYVPEPDGYCSKCELCFSIRKYLINSNWEAYPDLMPGSYYKQDY